MANLKKWVGVPYVKSRGHIVSGEQKQFVTIQAAWNYVHKHGFARLGHVFELTRGEAKKGIWASQV